MLKKWLLSLVAGLFAASLGSSSVFAYDGTKAKNYADTYATSRNVYYPYFSENDCTNFISQSLRAGGYSNVGSRLNDPTDYHYWYYDDYTGQWSNSWSVAHSFVMFQIVHTPGGYWGNSYGGVQGNNAYNDAYVGDVIAYDWESDGTWDHLGLEVGTGTDPDSGWTGDLVDTHSSGRYHAYWTLEMWNQWKYTTTIRTLHINSSNN